MTATIDQLSEIANNWKAADLGSLSILANWYNSQTGAEMPCMNCQGKKDRYFSQVIAYVSKVKSTGMKVTTDWKLKSNNAYPMAFGSGDFISNASMTEDKAIAFLKQNPNRIQIFAAYPTDWQQRIGGVVVNAPAKAVQTSTDSTLGNKKTRPAKK
jgi:hypothetical protein